NRVLSGGRIRHARQEQLIECEGHVAARNRGQLLRIRGDVSGRDEAPDRERGAVLEQQGVRRAKETVLPARFNVCALGGPPFDSSAIDRVVLALEQEIIVLVARAQRHIYLRIELIEAACAHKLQQLSRLSLELGVGPVYVDRKTQRTRVPLERSYNFIGIRVRDDVCA